MYRFGSLKESIHTLAYTCPVNVSVSGVATKCSTTSLPTCSAKHFKYTVTRVPSMSQSVGGENPLAVYRFGCLKASIQTLAKMCPVNVSIRGGESLLTVYRFGSFKESIQTLAHTCPVNVLVSGVATTCSTTSLPTCNAKHFECTATHVPSMSQSVGMKAN